MENEKLKEIKCGQIWKLKDPKKYSNVGYQDDLFIILSKEHDVWELGVFWWSGKGECGGARKTLMHAKEIIEIGEYIGELKDLVFNHRQPVEVSEKEIERVVKNIVYEQIEVLNEDEVHLKTCVWRLYSDITKAITTLIKNKGGER